MAWSKAGLRALLGAALAGASACMPPPPSHALHVRNPERKCALIWFSGCTALLGAQAEGGEAAADEDAGVSEGES